MRFALVSTYAPKACGIAVFSGDLRRAMLAANRGCRVDVVAMLDETAPVPTAPEVLTTVARNDPGSYRAAAQELADHQVDVVVIEHEFGLFGGPAGESILELAEQLSSPSSSPCTPSCRSRRTTNCRSCAGCAVVPCSPPSSPRLPAG